MHFTRMSIAEHIGGLLEELVEISKHKVARKKMMGIRYSKRRAPSMACTILNRRVTIHLIMGIRDSNGSQELHSKY